MGPNDNDRPLRLLSLDGGGVRGLSSLYIIRAIMTEVKHQGNLTVMPRPCDYFDMIAGTSTGGLIAVMLGILQMDVDECIRNYVVLSDEIFPKETNIALLKPVKVLFRKPRFNHERLETVVKDIVEKYLGGICLKHQADRKAAVPENKHRDLPVAGYQGRDTPMKFQAHGDNSLLTCRVFVCTTTKQQTNLRLIRSYNMPGALGANDVECAIWQACRATTAAPTFFKPIQIGPTGVKYCDGAFKFNNPVQQLKNEAQSVWGERKIGCILSVGTGLSKVMNVGNGLGLIDTLRRMATETEKTEEMFAWNVKGTELESAYFRFNVNRGLEEVALSEASKMADIDVATTEYLGHHIDKVRRCASQMLTPSLSCDSWPQHNNYNLQTRKGLFVPPRKAWKELERVCSRKQDGSTNTQPARQIVIHGMPGSGKSMLSDTFAVETAKNYWAVFKIDASSPTSAESGFKEIAAKLKIDFNVDALTNTLSDPKKPWLLVLDNVAPNVKVEDYLHLKGNATVILSTRDEKFYNGNVTASIELKEMEVDDAISLLLLRVQRWRQYEHKKEFRNSVKRIVQEDLGCLPLAILQAGGFIDQGSYAVEEFREIFAAKSDGRLDFLRIRPNEPENPNSVWITFQMCFEEIEELGRASDNEGKAIQARHALEIIRFFAFLKCSQIPERILVNASRKLHLATKDRGNHLYSLKFLQDNSPETLVTDVIRPAIRILHQFSLIQAYDKEVLRRRERIYSIHTLVKNSILLNIKLRDKENPHDSSRLWLEAVHTLSCALTFNPDIRDEALHRFSNPHIESCIGKIDLKIRVEAFANIGPKKPDLNLDFIWLHFARIFCENGNPKEGQRLQKEVLEYRQEYVKTEISVLEAMHDLASSLRDLGKHKDALKLREEVLKRLEVILPNYDNAVLDAKANLADSYTDFGRLGDAVTFQKQVVEGRMSSQNPSKISTSRRKLARSLSHMGNERAAHDIRTDVVAQLQDTESPLSGELLCAMSDLAHSYDVLGHILEARRLREEVLTRRLEIRSQVAASSEIDPDEDTHADLLAAQMDVATSLDAFEEYDMALKMKKAVLTGREKVFGQLHPETLKARQSIALHYGRREMLAEALEEHQKVLEASIHTYGDDYPMTLDSTDDVARLRTRLLLKRLREKHIDFPEFDREKKALRQIRERLVSAWETYFPDNHYRIWSAKNRLYDFLFKLHDQEEAQLLRDRLWQEQVEDRGRDNENTLATRARLASGFKRMDQRDRAIEMYREVMTAWTRIFGNQHPLAMESMAQVANLLRERQSSRKDDEDALDILQELVQLYVKTKGPQHPVVGRTERSIHEVRVKLKTCPNIGMSQSTPDVSIDGSYESECENADPSQPESEK